MKGLSHIYRPDLLQKDILCFYMVLMSIQIIALEGMEISLVKAGAMAFSFPFLSAHPFKKGYDSLILGHSLLDSSNMLQSYVFKCSIVG